jgi:hypothetical protein
MKIILSTVHLKTKDHLEEMGIGWKMLKRILKKQDVKVWIGLIDLRINAVFCERGNEPSDSMNYYSLLNWPNNY